MDLYLIIGGVLLAVVTKNRRWLFLSAAGVGWFILNVLYIAFQIASKGG